MAAFSHFRAQRLKYLWMRELFANKMLLIETQRERERASRSFVGDVEKNLNVSHKVHQNRFQIVYIQNHLLLIKINRILPSDCKFFRSIEATGGLLRFWLFKFLPCSVCTVLRVSILFCARSNSKANTKWKATTIPLDDNGHFSRKVRFFCDDAKRQLRFDWWCAWIINEVRVRA